MNATLRQAAKILSLFNETSVEQVQAIIKSGFLADLRDGNIDGVNRDAFRQLIGLKRLNIYTLLANYDRSVEEAIKAGKYNWFDNNITSNHFPSEEAGAKEVSIELVHFGRNMVTDEVLSELDKGVRLATLKELLALGSVWQDLSGRRFCACLCRCGSERYLGLGSVGSKWRDYCRFAAVHKYK